jgi:hypothetical protein
LLALVAAAVLGTAGVGVYVIYHARNGSDPLRRDDDEPVADLDTRVHNFCGACHNYPPAETFPKSAWRYEVEQGYRFFNQAGMPLRPPPQDEVIRHFAEQAPDQLPPARFDTATTPVPVRFEPISFPVMPGDAPPRISNVNLVHLFDDRRLDVLACDMDWGRVMLLRPYEKEPAWRLLYGTGKDKQFNPSHTEMVDLDGDGVKDILVANLGNFLPVDWRVGSVLWLRGGKDGRFTPITLFDGVGRVADVQAAHFFGTDKLDLIVAVFGWNMIGEIILLENQTTDWQHPKFIPHVLDQRHGTIHVPVADLNGDGKPDFVALISQEHETVVAFLNEGNGHFRKETIFKGPHPAYGSSGIQLVDLDGDGNLDVLYTNGDVLDKPYLLKPYHSIQWLRNPGNGTFPWEHHPITPMYGVHRAVAADFTGTGRKDVVAVGYLPVESFPQRKELNLDGIIYLEKTGPHTFARHSLETITCDHVTCAAGDIYGSGRIDLVTGNFTSAKEVDQAITIWRNMGPAEGRK